MVNVLFGHLVCENCKQSACAFSQKIYIHAKKDFFYDNFYSMSTTFYITFFTIVDTLFDHCWRNKKHLDISGPYFPSCAAVHQIWRHNFLTEKTTQIKTIFCVCCCCSKRQSMRLINCHTFFSWWKLGSKMEEATNQVVNSHRLFSPSSASASNYDIQNPPH